MTREELRRVVDDKVNEMFLAYQEAMGITHGDIDLEDLLTVEELEESLTDIIISSMEWNIDD